MASRAATKAAVNFTKIYSTLGLGKETVTSLQTFRKRHADAQRIHGQLSAQPSTVDFQHYRSILKNQNIVNEAENLLKGFKPTTYDVNTHIKAIEEFEAKAVAKAEETAAQIDVELKALQSTLENIESARPFEDLTAEDVGRAHPQIRETVDTMVKKGKWTIPGYKEKFGDLNAM